ncbi:hypothetical protein I2486_09560 [Cellulophaga sp. E16_2]|uniref:hypothetical protein n=1 Tax=Cellulophaga sp. E16_2 TaxID=2789297 RepID=UPI001A92AD63|nr:hypothetical protein [Cellulophaga sp. E16_2]MBO0591653.1 hypothetical protein [Cellulophaga sp. E16_2]
MDSFQITEKEYIWTRQIISSKGNSKFKIDYWGDKNSSNITSKDGLPSIVTLTNIDDEEQILIYDGALHGYNAVFWEEFPEEINNREQKQRYVHNGQSEFEVIILTRYSPHIKEEFDEDMERDGFVTNNRGQKLGKEAFSNGFDSIEIYGIGTDGKRIEILAEETA